TTSGIGRIREFAPSGLLLHTFTFPDGAPVAIAMDANGNIDVYNGAFHPSLITLSPVTGNIIANTTFPGWSTSGNAGLAAYGNFVFASDEATADSGEPSGIVAFNINNFTGQRFASGTSYVHVTIGPDGLLYALADGGAINVFDPRTFAFVRG